MIMLSIMARKANHERALREYESVHRDYMSTSVFSPEGKAIKEKLKQAREKYDKARK